MSKVLSWRPNCQRESRGIAAHRLHPQRAGGASLQYIARGQHEEAFYEALWSELRAQGGWRGDIGCRQKTGGVFLSQQAISTLRAPDDMVEYYVCLFSDITRQRQYQRELERFAHFDPLTQISAPASVDDIIERILAAVVLPFERDECKLIVSASIGVSFYPQAEDLGAEQLIRQADKAMYLAKAAGKNQACRWN